MKKKAQPPLPVAMPEPDAPLPELPPSAEHLTALAHLETVTHRFATGGCTREELDAARAWAERTQ